jgi:aminotransferase
MPISISKISEGITQSEIRNMSIECDRVNGVNLSQGICDLPLPSPVQLGAKDAIDGGENHYGRYDGEASLRQAIAGKMRDFNRINVDPDKNIVVSAGATGAFYSACLALLNPGDEVILFEPFYGYHCNTLMAAGAVPVFTTLTPPEWTIDFDHLESIVTPHTRAIMICTPANPSGKSFTVEEIEHLAEFAIRHDLFVFTDEIYEYFLYDGRRHVSPAAIEAIWDRTIAISGYSKTFSITGWRIGYAVCHEKWSQMIGYLNDLIYVCAPRPLQTGVARGISELPSDFYVNLCQQYAVKRELICNALTRIGMPPYKPHGAYYVLADVTDVPGATGKEKAMHILRQTGVATVPGTAFYRSGHGNNLVRFCYAKSTEILEEAVERLARL